MRTMALAPLSVIHACPSGPTITPCGAEGAGRSKRVISPVAGSSRPMSPLCWPVNHTRPSGAGATSCGPMLGATGNTSNSPTGRGVLASSAVGGGSVGSGSATMALSPAGGSVGAGGVIVLAAGSTVGAAAGWVFASVAGAQAINSSPSAGIANRRTRMAGGPSTWLACHLIMDVRGAGFNRAVRRWASRHVGDDSHQDQQGQEHSDADQYELDDLLLLTPVLGGLRGEPCQPLALLGVETGALCVHVGDVVPLGLHQPLDTALRFTADRQARGDARIRVEHGVAFLADGCAEGVQVRADRAESPQRRAALHTALRMCRVERAAYPAVVLLACQFVRRAAEVAYQVAMLVVAEAAPATRRTDIALDHRSPSLLLEKCAGHSIGAVAWPGT